MKLLDVFKINNRWCVAVIVAFAIIHVIVLTNAILHDPRFGYDAPAHLDYVRTLATGRLPTPADSHEFFSPPLPYVPAAVFWKLFDGGSSDGRAMAALKLAQGVQLICSIIVCWSILAIAKLIRPDRWMLLASLVGVGMVPAYYRTFAMIRGEPMMVALLMLGTYHTLKCFAIARPTASHAIIAGILLGGAVMSRQWAFFALPGLGLVGLWRLFSDSAARKSTIVSGLILLSSFAVVGGPFYAHLHREYGSIRAFNRPPDEQADDAPMQRSSASLLESMIHAPVRDAFDGHPILLFYADVWGDYARYFLISARDGKGRLVKSALIDRTIESGKSKSNNAASMPAYLGRVCAVSFLPTALILCGFVFSLTRKNILLSCLGLMTLGTILGYAWFVATYPNVKLDTVKASYPLHVYPLLAIATGAFWCSIRDRFPRFANGLGVCVLVIFLHNLPAMVTRYTMSW